MLRTKKEKKEKSEKDKKPRGHDNRRPKHAMMVKVVVIGDTGVGKTSLAMSLLHHLDPTHNVLVANGYGAEGDEGTVPTIGVDRLAVRLSDELPLVELWDTAGQERFMSITKSYFRLSDVCLCVCDASDVTSVQSLEKVWIPALREGLAPAPAGQLIIVCNKSDVANGVTVNHARRLARELGVPFVLVSSALKEKSGIADTITVLFDAVRGVVAEREKQKERECGSDNDSADSVDSIDIINKQRRRRCNTVGICCL